MPHTILLEKQSLKFLKNLDKDTSRRIIEKLEMLEEDPIPPNARKLLSVKDNAYRIRVGDYRILYRLDANNIIVFSINKRSIVYKR